MERRVGRVLTIAAIVVVVGLTAFGGARVFSPSDDSDGPRRRSRPCRTASRPNPAR